LDPLSSLLAANALSSPQSVSSTGLSVAARLLGMTLAAEPGPSAQDAPQAAGIMPDAFPGINRAIDEGRNINTIDLSLLSGVVGLTMDDIREMMDWLSSTLLPADLVATCTDPGQSQSVSTMQKRLVVLRRVHEALAVYSNQRVSDTEERDSQRR
jgi:hypothetical protein